MRINVRQQAGSLSEDSQESRKRERARYPRGRQLSRARVLFSLNQSTTPERIERDGNGFSNQDWQLLEARGPFLERPDNLSGP